MTRSTNGAPRAVLVVEDEDLLITIIRTMLMQKGYEVFTASTAEEGLALFSRLHHTIAKVLMDYRLPGSSGGEVFARLRDIQPDVKVVVMTGYLESEERDALLAAGVIGILTKPFSMVELLKAAHESSD